jgi:hypothetical protein
MSDQPMTRNEIVRRLRLVMSQRVRHRPLTMMMIAARTGLTRASIYNAVHGRMSDEVQHLLSQVLAEVPVNDLIADSAGLRRC